jgi:hypothetical protein
MLRHLRIIFISTLLLAPACASLVGNLPAIISATQTASLVISTIESFIGAYFAAHPDAVKEAIVDAAIIKAKAADVVVLEVATAADSIDKGKLSIAFAELEAAYEALLVVVKPFGVSPAGAAGGMKMAAASGPVAATLTVPAKLTMKLR